MKVGTQSETITVLGETPLVADHHVRRRPGDHAEDGREHPAQRPQVPGPVAAGPRHAPGELLRPDQDRGRRHQLRRRHRAAPSSSTWTAATTTTASSAACCSSSAPTPIQEYKVTTQRYSAEYGRSVGGVVNVITKSGTNDLHGSAFLFARNQAPQLAHLLRGAGGRREARLQPAAVRRHAGRAASARTRRTSSCPTSATAATTPRRSHERRAARRGGPIEKPFRNHLLTASWTSS